MADDGRSVWMVTTAITAHTTYTVRAVTAEAAAAKVRASEIRAHLPCREDGYGDDEAVICVKEQAT